MSTTSITLALVAALGLWGCDRSAPAPTRPPAPQNSAVATPATASRPGGGLGSASFALDPPSEWTKIPVRLGSPRKAQYLLPGGPSIGGPADLLIYHFGQGSAESTEAKIAQWAARVAKPDGMGEEDHYRRQELEVVGFAVTQIEIHGNYREPSFGGPELPLRLDTTMLLAVIHAPEGDYFVQTVGDRSTLAHWRKSWDGMVSGMRAAEPQPAEDPPLKKEEQR